MKDVGIKKIVLLTRDLKESLVSLGSHLANLENSPCATFPEFQKYFGCQVIPVAHIYYRWKASWLSNLDSFQILQISYAELRNTVSNNKIQTEALDSQINEINKTISPTKFGKYTLAGGENYREILLTLPNKPMEAGMAGENWYTQFIKRGGEPEWSQLTPVRQQEIINSMPAEARNYSTSPEYRSSHFDEPNILAHMRVNDRIDADGKKMLLVEEIQSDWHQAGREKGYKTKESLEKWYSQNKLDNDPSFADLNSEQRSVIERNRNAGMGGDYAVPDAPFKDTWYQLALKRLTKYAADNGYERIGLTTGKQQAERFDLSKQVDDLNVFRNPDGTFDIKATLMSDGSIQDIGKKITPEKLPEYVGKELSTKLLEQKPITSKFYNGEDLRVGGEGMKKYYDEIYPKFLDKYGKKYGASVGETKIKTGRGVPGGEPVRYLDITPQMKQGTSKGQPLFAAVPALPIATMDYTDPFPDTAR
jgi:hypothetical protein